MALIKADPGELLSAAGQLERSMVAGQEFAGSSGSISGVGWATGSGDASAAINDFVNAWRNGVNSMNADGERLARLLRLAANAYSDADSAVAEAAR